MASSIIDSALHDGVSNPASQGFVADLLSRTSSATAVTAAVIVGGAVFLSLLNALLAPKMDASEPPTVKPTIPLIGHIIGIIRHQSDYHRIVYNSNPSKEIVTLPMLNGKMYSVFDPQLIQAVLRKKLASFDPFTTEFAQKTFGLTAETFAKITGNPQLVPDFTDAIHSSFQTESLHKMNVHFLTQISNKLGKVGRGARVVDTANSGKESLIDRGVQVENLYLWIRDIMSMATTRALYGDHDPYVRDPSLIEMMWTFEKSLPYFLLSIFPSITMRKAYLARSKLQTTMAEYYTAEHDLNDPTTSQLAINRANVLRKYSFTGEEIGFIDAILPVVATTNAVPTFYWLLLYVLARPELVSRLRAEVLAAATITSNADGDGAGRTATFNIANFDAQIPLLISCYRETMRLTNHSVSMRRIMGDLLVGGSTGRQYLLKKGTDIQLPAGVTHYSKSVWGEDASEFDPERFLPPSPSTEKTQAYIDAERKKKDAYFPFGGGRHLCPGRNFAFAEIMGLMCVLLLGYDIEPVGMEFAELKMGPPLMASGAVKPENRGVGLGGKILRRKGWEDVQWHFEC
ncbi:cytochrome P450 [Dactylonectria estremocensis]|uniref:Cytochrome P450 n=1 Tax=Dactylonectria estremocensis TaxID=1079267 RepID=A0A9P9IWY0_9HYPO|nr:cytochrome P450 [Dactylonectria estremocensis]